MPPKPSQGPQKRIRMRDVAERCNVSISTVSLVLSGDTRIPEDTTKLVLQAVKALEYRPSVVARNLARRSSRTVAVILPEFAFQQNQPFFYQALAGIHAVTQTAGYKIIVEAANNSFLERRYYHRLLKEQSVDGVIYMAARSTDNFLNEMAREPYPFVLLGCGIENSDLITVKGDDVRGAQLGVNHLISLGHKNIGFVKGHTDDLMSRDREKGFREAMRKANYPVKNEWIISGEWDMKRSEEITSTLIEEGVTALFSSNDIMAYGILRGALSLGKKIPTELAVVGMDDLPLSEWMNPALTTVRYDITKMATLAAKYVINRIQSPLIDRKFLEEIPLPNLIVRSSCGSKK